MSTVLLHSSSDLRQFKSWFSVLFLRGVRDFFSLLQRCHLTVSRLRTLRDRTPSPGQWPREVSSGEGVDGTRQKRAGLCYHGGRVFSQPVPACSWLCNSGACVSPSCGTVTLQRYFSRAFLQQCPRQAAQCCWIPPHPLAPLPGTQLLHKGVRNVPGSICRADLSEEVFSVLKTEDAADCSAWAEVNKEIVERRTHVEYQDGLRLP